MALYLMLNACYIHFLVKIKEARVNWTEGPLPLRPKKKSRYSAWDVGDMSFRYGYHKRLTAVPEDKRPNMGSDGLVSFDEPSVSITYDSVVGLDDDPEEVG